MSVPTAAESEKALLGSILLHPETLHQHNQTLETNHFYHPTHQQIWDALNQLTLAQQPTDFASIITHIKTTQPETNITPETLLNLQSGAGPLTSTKHYTKTIIEKHKQRKVIQLLTETRENLKTGNIDETIHQTLTDLNNILDETQNPLARERVDTIQQMLHELEIIQEGGFIGAPTGFPKLDKLLNGGLRNGSVTTIGAPTGQGKSALAAAIANHATKRGTVIFCSLEMDAIENEKRLLASATGIPHDRILTADLEDAHWTQINDYVSEIKNNIIWIDRADITIQQIKHEIIRQSTLKVKPVLLVVDYIQLITPTDMKQSRVQQVTEISRTLKQLARDQQIPVLQLAQLNRAVMGEPTLANLRESGSIEQDSDTVLLLWSPNGDATREIIVAKQRNGETGRVAYTFNGALFDFREKLLEYPPL